MAKYIFLILSFSVLGCASGNNTDTSTKIVRKYEAVSKSGKILDSDRFRKGGKLLIIPFKAGQGVQSDDQLDKVALLIIRGVSDVLKEHQSNFEVLAADNADEAEFVMKGYITSMKEPTKMKKWLPGQKAVMIGFEGKIIDRVTNEPIFVFNDTIEMIAEKDAFKKLGELVGRHLGQFMVSVGSIGQGEESKE